MLDVNAVSPNESLQRLHRGFAVNFATVLSACLLDDTGIFIVENDQGHTRIIGNAGIFGGEGEGGGVRTSLSMIDGCQ